MKVPSKFQQRLPIFVIFGAPILIGGLSIYLIHETSPIIAFVAMAVIVVISLIRARDVPWVEYGCLWMLSFLLAGMLSYLSKYWIVNNGIISGYIMGLAISFYVDKVNVDYEIWKAADLKNKESAQQGGADGARDV